MTDPRPIAGTPEAGSIHNPSVAGCVRCHRTIYSNEIQRWDFIWRNEWSIEGTCKECSEELLDLEMSEQIEEECSE